MFSKDFKRLSLDQLRGKWWNVIGAFAAIMLVLFSLSMIIQVPYILFNIFLGIANNGFGSNGFLVVLSIIAFCVYIALIIALLVIEACIVYGIHKYLIEFVRTGTPDIRYMFSGFSYGTGVMKRSFILLLLISIFTTLWSILFLIPGIVASYRYLLAFYILADDDNISARDAINLSKKMMYGHKWRAFCLSLSFLGWLLLSALTFGIGYFFLVPYMNTAITNFYEYIRGIYDSKQDFTQVN